MPLTEIIAATGDAVAADPAAAALVFRATGTAGTAGEGLSTTVRTGRHTLTVDEPAPLGGQDSAANPVEHALAALISCQVVTYRFWAARLGIAVEGIDINAEGDLDVRGLLGLDPAVRPGFTAVRLRVTLSGPEGPERYRELQEAVDAHCPVLDLFANKTLVATTLAPTALTIGAPA